MRATANVLQLGSDNVTAKNVTIKYNQATAWVGVDVDGVVYDGPVRDKVVELSAITEVLPDGEDIDEQTGARYLRQKAGKVTYELVICSAVVFRTHEHPARSVEGDVVTYKWQAPAGGVGGVASLGA